MIRILSTQEIEAQMVKQASAEDQPVDLSELILQQFTKQAWSLPSSAMDTYLLKMGIDKEAKKFLLDRFKELFKKRLRPKDVAHLPKGPEALGTTGKAVTQKGERLFGDAPRKINPSAPSETGTLDQLSKSRGSTGGASKSTPTESLKTTPSTPTDDILVGGRAKSPAPVTHSPKGSGAQQGATDSAAPGGFNWGHAGLGLGGGFLLGNMMSNRGGGSGRGGTIVVSN